MTTHYSLDGVVESGIRASGGNKDSGGGSRYGQSVRGGRGGVGGDMGETAAAIAGTGARSSGSLGSHRSPRCSAVGASTELPGAVSGVATGLAVSSPGSAASSPGGGGGSGSGGRDGGDRGAGRGEGDFYRASEGSGRSPSSLSPASAVEGGTSWKVLP